MNRRAFITGLGAVLAARSVLKGCRRDVFIEIAGELRPELLVTGSPQRMRGRHWGKPGRLRLSKCCLPTPTMCDISLAPVE